MGHVDFEYFGKTVVRLFLYLPHSTLSSWPRAMGGLYECLKNQIATNL